MKVRTGNDKDIPQILTVAYTLHEWFTQSGLYLIEKDLHCQKMLVAHSQGEITGFLTYFSHEGVAHIGWMGVTKHLHRSGIGASLTQELCELMLSLSIHEIRLKTLGEGVIYEPYIATRLFYKAMGFSPFRTVHTDNPEFPEELELRLDLKTQQLPWRLRCLNADRVQHKSFLP